MTRRIKGFTLIELIVVTAIIGILMSALMNFYRPIRQTYVDSTMLEGIRTSHDGIMNYLTENLKYAEKLSIYDDGASVPVKFADDTTANVSVSSPSTAYEAFMKEYGGINKVDEGSGYVGPKYTGNIDPKYVHVIVINRATGYSEAGKVIQETATEDDVSKTPDMYTGRIITNIVENPRYPTPSGSPVYAPNVSGLTYPGASYTNAFGYGAVGDRQKDLTDAGGSYMALGGAYYGRSSYGIYIDKEKSWEKSGSGSDITVKYTGALHFVIQNTVTDESGVVKDGGTYNGSTVTVNGGTVTVASRESVKTMNRRKNAPVHYYTNNGDILDKTKYNSAVPAGSFVTRTGGETITNGNKNTYIVFVEPIENE